jgi:hypothetical protein
VCKVLQFSQGDSSTNLNLFEVTSTFNGILCHITDSRIKTSEVPKRSNWPVEELPSGSQTPTGVLSSAGKVTGREKLVSAIRLNETEQWRGIEHVLCGMDAPTTLVLSFDAVAGVPNNRARQR